MVKILYNIIIGILKYYTIIIMNRYNQYRLSTGENTTSHKVFYKLKSSRSAFAEKQEVIFSVFLNQLGKERTYNDKRYFRLHS